MTIANKERLVCFIIISLMLIVLAALAGVVRKQGNVDRKGIFIKDCTFEDIDPNGKIKLLDDDAVFIIHNPVEWSEIVINRAGRTIVGIDIDFICPKCQGTKLRFKPNPVTLKREVGATAEVPGKWSCAKCGHPIE